MSSVQILNPWEHIQVDVGKSLKPRTVLMWGWRVLPEGLRGMTKILGKRKMDVVPVEMRSVDCHPSSVVLP